MFTQVFEWESELLEPTYIFDCNRDNLLLLYTIFLFRFIDQKLWLDRLLANELRDLYLPCKHYFKSLYLGGLPAVAQEVFHASLELSFEKFFEAICKSKFLISISQ